MRTISNPDPTAGENVNQDALYISKSITRNLFFRIKCLQKSDGVGSVSSGVISEIYIYTRKAKYPRKVSHIIIYPDSAQVRRCGNSCRNPHEKSEP